MSIKILFDKEMPWEIRRYMLADSFRNIIPWKIKKFYYSIRDWFNPCQKWLIKEIPNHWSDKTSLIPKLLIACLIDFVEGEKCFERIDYNIYDKDGNDTGELNDFADHLKDYYEVASKILPDLRNELEREYNKRSNDYTRIDQLEEDINQLEGIICKWVVENRDQLWT